MPDPGMAAAFEDITEPEQIALDVSLWIGQRVTDSGLGGEVDDAINFSAEKIRLIETLSAMSMRSKRNRGKAPASRGARV